MAAYKLNILEESKRERERETVTESLHRVYAPVYHLELLQHVYSDILLMDASHDVKEYSLIPVIFITVITTYSFSMSTIKARLPAAMNIEPNYKIKQT